MGCILKWLKLYGQVLEKQTQLQKKKESIFKFESKSDQSKKYFVLEEN